MLLSATGALAVTPFAFIRVRDAQWAVAALDIGLVITMFTLFLYVLLWRETRIPGIIMGWVFVGTALLSLHLLGASQVFWLYPTLTAAFFMLSTGQATFLSLVTLGFVVQRLHGDQTPLTIASMCLTLVVTVLFAYSFALTNRRQQAQLEHQATVDPLTGSGNRRTLTEKLDRVIALFRRDRTPASVLIMDVDLFKRVNDTHGHTTGDQILMDLAGLIRGHIRATETLFRYGGEEFVVVAESCDLDGAWALAEKLRRLVENHEFCHGIRLTVSLGIAGLAPAEGRQGWFGRADAALFQAKKNGRNQSVRAGEAPGFPCPGETPQEEARTPA